MQRTIGLLLITIILSPVSALAQRRRTPAKPSRAAATATASAAVIDQVKQNKAKVRASIQSVREGLDKLEIDFRNTPELQPYYIKLAGVAARAASAEDLAAANQFDKAGRTLLEVVSHLTDVLLEMR